MKNLIIAAILLTGMAMQGCSKKQAIQEFEFVKVTVANKTFINTPTVKVYVNDISGQNIPPNEWGTILVPAGSGQLTMVIKNAETGEQYLDSTFAPEVNNWFTVLIAPDLGLNQFYTPPITEPRPVAEDSFRVQLFHKIEYQGVKRTVTFKVFEDLSGTISSVDLYELPIQITVPYGRISEDLDIPYEKKANGRYKKYRLKAYDAFTGEVLVDILPPYPNSLSIGAGQFRLVNLRTKEDPSQPTGMSWDHISTDYYEPLN